MIIGLSNNFISTDNDEIPIVLWWTPFGSNNQIKTCGNVRCYFTHNRAFEANAHLKVRDSHAVSQYLGTNKIKPFRISLNMCVINFSQSILFYGSNFRVHDLPNWRSNVISWGLLHEESPRNNPILVHEKALNLFNYSSTFSRYSNVPLVFLDLPSLETLIGKIKHETAKLKTCIILTYTLYTYVHNF